MFHIKEKVECVEREIAMRKRVYPAFVAKGRMRQEKADYEIAAMESVLNDMKFLERMEDFFSDTRRS